MIFNVKFDHSDKRFDLITLLISNCEKEFGFSF